MPPKPSFTKQRILEVALELARHDGFSAITARNVAQHLDASTRPVYSYFDSIADLRAQVLGRARDKLMACAREFYTDSVFLNCGTGIVVFARDNSLLYRALFLETAAHRSIRDELIATVESQMVKDRRFAALDRTSRLALLNKMYTFTHGLASFACVGLLEDDSTRAIIATLDEVGSPIIKEALEVNA